MLDVYLENLRFRPGHENMTEHFDEEGNIERIDIHLSTVEGDSEEGSGDETFEIQLLKDSEPLIKIPANIYYSVHIIEQVLQVVEELKDEDWKEERIRFINKKEKVEEQSEE